LPALSLKLGLESGAGDEIPVCFGGDRKTVGHVDSLGCQLSDELAEGSVLAANQRNVLDADFLKPANIAKLGGCHHENLRAI
jgi:hypothetical protein